MSLLYSCTASGVSSRVKLSCWQPFCQSLWLVVSRDLLPCPLNGCLGRLAKEKHLPRKMILLSLNIRGLLIQVFRTFRRFSISCLCFEEIIIEFVSFQFSHVIKALGEGKFNDFYDDLVYPAPYLIKILMSSLFSRSLEHPSLTTIFAQPDYGSPIWFFHFVQYSRHAKELLVAFQIQF